jgi:hypothetical protein
LTACHVSRSFVVVEKGRREMMWVRHAADAKAYEFSEDGGQCGNFAILELASLPPEWIQTVKGGHSAIARVSVRQEEKPLWPSTASYRLTAGASGAS